MYSCPCPLRHNDQRKQLAHRLRTLRNWPEGRHRLRRPTEPFALAEVRMQSTSLDGLVRSAVTGLQALDERSTAAHGRLGQPDANGFKPLSIVLACAESQGLNLEAVNVHYETREDPWEAAWPEEVLVATIDLPVSDEKYAAALESVWQDYQQSLFVAEQDRADFATYLRLRERFGPLIDSKP